MPGAGADGYHVRGRSGEPKGLHETFDRAVVETVISTGIDVPGDRRPVDVGHIGRCSHSANVVEVAAALEVVLPTATAVVSLQGALGVVLLQATVSEPP